MWRLAELRARSLFLFPRLFFISTEHIECPGWGRSFYLLPLDALFLRFSPNCSFVLVFILGVGLRRPRIGVSRYSSNKLINKHTHIHKYIHTYIHTHTHTPKKHVKIHENTIKNWRTIIFCKGAKVILINLWDSEIAIFLSISILNYNIYYKSNNNN